ncbi:MAG: hypothetical protein OXD42_11835 [Rhodospirillaceae bacterium]|nr:hypothetical protein [Rhodospirillaceae bacterium]
MDRGDSLGPLCFAGVKDGSYIRGMVDRMHYCAPHTPCIHAASVSFEMCAVVRDDLFAAVDFRDSLRGLTPGGVITTFRNRCVSGAACPK